MGNMSLKVLEFFVQKRAQTLIVLFLIPMKKVWSFNALVQLTMQFSGDTLITFLSHLRFLYQKIASIRLIRWVVSCTPVLL